MPGGLSVIEDSVMMKLWLYVWSKDLTDKVRWLCDPYASARVYTAAKF